MKRFIFTILAAASALPAARTEAATVLARSVIGSGGAPSAGAVAGNGTLGQAAIGASQNAVMKVFHGFWFGGALNPTIDVADDPAGGVPAPLAFSFGAPAPNPTRGLAEFALALPEPASVRLEVIDVAGRLVDVAVDRRYAAGAHRLVWNGRNGRGPVLASGVYYARLAVDGRVAAKRSIVVVR